MIDFLMMLHFHKGLGQYMPVRPPEIPFGVLLVLYTLEFKLFDNFRQNIVYAVLIKWISLPETLTTILSNLTTEGQLGENFGWIGSEPLNPRAY